MKLRTIGEALDQGRRVFWYAFPTGEMARFARGDLILWWQDGRDRQPQCADQYALPDLLAACELVEPAITSVLDELGQRKATNWGLVNDCLVAVAKAIAKAKKCQ